MASRVSATFPCIATLLLLLSTTLVNFASADDLTGMAQDDPKDTLPPSAQQASSPCYNSGFLPMPYWARGVVMPPLPDALKPMGKKAVLTTLPVAAPAPLAPPRDEDRSTVVVAKPTVVTPAPATNPALIAVSPFLDWIKTNPQAAAEQARQQAASYQAGAEAATPGAPPASATPSGPTAPAPYWMPPLIDTAPFGSGNVTGSSAAIYSTPQR